MSSDSFGTRGRLDVGDDSYEVFRLGDLGAQLPYSLKVLLENLLRNEDGVGVTADDVARPGGAGDGSPDDRELAFTPARILMQDFTGVPAVVDLAAMRDAIAALGGDPAGVDPHVPVDLVIDHSVIVDVHGTARRLRPQRRARVRTATRSATSFLRWGQSAFEGLRVVPPDTGICHQVNLEYLAQRRRSRNDAGQAYPDTLVGTDSHTPMVNGLGVLGWGVGGIEAEAAMLGQPISMLVPEVVGFRLRGALPEGATATDLVLTVTQLLRRHGVVGKFVEFYGPGRRERPGREPGDDRQHVAGVRLDVTIFPIDDADAALPALHRPARAPGRASSRRTRRNRACGTTRAADPDLLGAPRARPRHGRAQHRRAVAPAGPRPARPTRSRCRRALRDCVASLGPEAAGRAPPIGDASSDVGRVVPGERPARAAATGTIDRAAPLERRRSTESGRRRPRVASPSPSTTARRSTLDHGHVVIAAITSCTNTSNPTVMIAAGAARQATRSSAASRVQAVGEDARSHPARRSSSTTTSGPGCSRTSRSSGSTSSATAARRASATRARSHPEISAAVDRADLVGRRRCSRATATSRAASTPMYA